MMQLVVSETVTNARTYAPGQCLLILEVNQGAAEVTVWDSSTTLPAIGAMDPGRVGHHSLEIVLTVCQTFCVHSGTGGRAHHRGDRTGRASGRRPGRTAANLTHTRPDERSPKAGPEPVGYPASARQVSLRFRAIPP